MRKSVLWSITFVSLVIASNWLTAEFGLIGGFVTAGTFTAGLVLTARDGVREAGGLVLALICIAAGAGASYFMASPQLALASAVAFGAAEMVDTLVYEPLRKLGKMRALAWSNAAGSVIDSFVFLSLAGFAIWPAILGQVSVKWVMSVGLPLAAWKAASAVLRHRIRPESA